MESDDQATAFTLATMRYFKASSVQLLLAGVYTAAAAAVEVAFCKRHAGCWVSSKEVLKFCLQELIITFPFAHQTSATVLLLLMDDRFLVKQLGFDAMSHES